MIVQLSVIGGEAILNNPDFKVEALKGATHRQIWMNVRDDGPFKDVKGRTAVALGLDRQALVDTCLGGYGDIGNDHPIAPAYGYADAAPQRERDVEGAMALLEEAGQAGLAVTMHAPKLQEIPQLAELVQSQLKDIGMDVTLNVESTDTFYNQWCLVYDSTKIGRAHV